LYFKYSPTLNPTTVSRALKKVKALMPTQGSYQLDPSFFHLLERLCHILHALFRRHHTHSHNRFTALLEFIRDHLGKQVPERYNKEG